MKTRTSWHRPVNRDVIEFQCVRYDEDAQKQWYLTSSGEWREFDGWAIFTDLPAISGTDFYNLMGSKVSWDESVGQLLVDMCRAGSFFSPAIDELDQASNE